MDLSCPLFTSLLNVAIRARSVGADWTGTRRSGKTASSNAGVACSSSKYFRISGTENIRHHAATASASDKDARGVSVVRLDGVVDHVDEDLIVRVFVMGKHRIA